ncbi:nucleotide-binding alpha-beta plait domain-containing protein [Tanacetum coccineum]
MGSWFSTLQQASYDFKVDDRIAWIEVEGVPFKFWTENTFKRIAHKWGELLEVDDVEELCYHSRRLCIRTSSRSTIRDYFKIVFRGNVYWIRANEVPGWVPDFTEESDEDDQSVEESKGEEHNTHDAEDIDSGTDVEEVAETDFEVTNAQNVPTSEDIFGIYPLLDNLKKKKTCNDTVQEDTLSHPPGFTPKENNNEIKADETQNYKKHNKDDWPNGDDKLKELFTYYKVLIICNSARQCKFGCVNLMSSTYDIRAFIPTPYKTKREPGFEPGTSMIMDANVKKHVYNILYESTLATLIEHYQDLSSHKLILILMLV